MFPNFAEFALAEDLDLDKVSVGTTVTHHLQALQKVSMIISYLRITPEEEICGYLTRFYSKVTQQIICLYMNKISCWSRQVISHPKTRTLQKRPNCQFLGKT